MAHGTTLDVGSGGDTMCTIDPTTVAASGFPTTGKQQAFVIYASAGANTAPTVYLLGQKARAASLGFTLSTEDVALLAEIEAGVDGLEALATTGNGSLSSILIQLQATQTTLENVATISHQSQQTDLLTIIVNLLTPPTTGTADDLSYHELLVQIRDALGGGGGDTPGGATFAEQEIQSTHLSAIETATEAVQAAIASQATAANQAALALLVDGIESQLTTLAGHVDGIESQLTTLAGHVDGLETALAAQATAANQTTSIGHLAAIETAVEGPLTLGPRTSGGTTPYKNVDLDETGVLIKGSPGQVYGWFIGNDSTDPMYVKLYNKATAATVGTDTPVLTLRIPPGQGANAMFDVGIEFTAGISAGATTGPGDADTGAPAANDVTFNLFYK